MRLTALTLRPRRWPLLGLSALLLLSLATLLLTGGGSAPTVEAQSYSGHHGHALRQRVRS